LFNKALPIINRSLPIDLFLYLNLKPIFGGLNLPKFIYPMKKYFTEKNALTVMVSLFCFVMMIVSFVKDQSLWQSVAFALAFSFSVELICHRAKENG
jgi:hypothetical protein